MIRPAHETGGTDVFTINKADRFYILAALGAKSHPCGYERTLIERLEASICPCCFGCGEHSDYSYGVTYYPCDTCHGSGFAS